MFNGRTQSNAFAAYCCELPNEIVRLLKVKTIKVNCSDKEIGERDRRWVLKALSNGELNTNPRNKGFSG